MKRLAPIFALLLLAALPLSLAGQTLVIGYMKVAPENESLYLEVEKQWKEIHKKRIEAGQITGWQLWKKHFAGSEDEYQYAVINWYNDLGQYFAPSPEGFWEEVSGLFDDGLYEKTLKSRAMVRVEVQHNMASAENNKGAGFIVINHMKPAEGKWDDYVEMEREVFKPLHEEGISRGHRSHWGLWVSYPYEKGQGRLITVDGYADAAQMFGDNGGGDIFSEVHPDLDPSEVWNKISGLREMESIEFWELVDSVFPEE